MIKQSLYYYITRIARWLFNIHLSPRQAYQQDYLQSPRWKVLSSLRKAYDGHQCTCGVFWHRCEVTHGLQVHHRTYVYRGAPGLSGMINEFLSLTTLCNRHHDMAHGKEEN